MMTQTDAHGHPACIARQTAVTTDCVHEFEEHSSRMGRPAMVITAQDSVHVALSKRCDGNDVVRSRQVRDKLGWASTASESTSCTGLLD